MNIRRAFIYANRKRANNIKKLNGLLARINKIQAQGGNTNSLYDDIGNLLVENNLIEVVTIPIDWNLTVSYKFCTNYDQAKDSIKRECVYENKTTEFKVGKAIVVFKRKEEPFFYSQNNFFIELCNFQRSFYIFKIDLFLNVIYPVSNEERLDFKIENKNLIEKDPVFKKILEIVTKNQ